MQKSPWWAIPVLSGVLAFVGIALAQGVTIWLDRRRAAREDRRRWDNERRQAYVRYVTHLSREAIRRARGGGWTDDEAMEFLESLTDVDLLASSKVAGVVEKSSAFLLGQRSEDTDWASESGKHRDAIIAAVRDELGITTASRKIILDTSSLFGVLIPALKAIFQAFGDILRQVVPFRITRVKR